MKEVNQRFEVDAPWELAILAYDRKSWSIPNPDFKVRQAAACGRVKKERKKEIEGKRESVCACVCV
jgi:hypothetical protein